MRSDIKHKDTFVFVAGRFKDFKHEVNEYVQVEGGVSVRDANL